MTHLLCWSIFQRKGRCSRRKGVTGGNGTQGESRRVNEEMGVQGETVVKKGVLRDGTSPWGVVL